MKHSLNKGTAKESILANFSEQQNLEDTLNNKQNKLVSGTNIKTINGNSILGSGNITIEGGSGGVSSVFENVNTLPDSPDGQKIYRVIVYQYNYYIYYGGSLLNLTELFAQSGGTLNIIQVSSLPETPEIYLNQETYTMTVYLMGDGIYGYNATGDNTWLSTAELIALGGGDFGTAYGGIITSLDTTNLTDGYAYIYPISLSYSYINVNSDSQFEFVSSNELSELKNNLVGREGTGTGSGSEVFNNYDENVASGVYSHAEGSNTTASGVYSHAEGSNTTASGESAHAEGSSTTASGTDSHAEGSDTKAYSISSHAEGCNTTASGARAHAEGLNTIASGQVSHAEGINTIASGENSHAEGYHTTALAKASHAEGYGTTYGSAHTFTRTSTQYQYTSTSTFKFGVVFTDQKETHATVTAVSGTESPYTYTFDTDFVTTEGETVNLYQVVGVASGGRSHAEGSNTTASGQFSHAEGSITIASGESSHAEGYQTTASGNSSHAEGDRTTASGDKSHAEGAYTKASGDYSHAEGSSTTASGINSHAEGYKTTAYGSYSHAEGTNTTASGSYGSHAEGYYTAAYGDSSHAEGYYTTASSQYQHVQGKYNINDNADKYAHIVGNGSSDTRRFNAHTLDWSGNAWFAGNVRVGGTSWDDATELGSGGGSSINKYELVIDSAIPEIPADTSLGTYTLTETQLNAFQGLGSTYVNRTYLPTISASIGIKMSMNGISMESIEQMVGYLSTEIDSELNEGFIKIDLFKYTISGTDIASVIFCITLNASGGTFISGTLQYNNITYNLLHSLQQGFGSITITIEYRE